MRTIDLSPLYRSYIGVDRVATMLYSLDKTDSATFPPYDIEVVGENRYRISMALAGFKQDEIRIEQAENCLTVTGVREISSTDSTFLHQGIAKRNFERRFQLAEHVEVVSANYQDGLLHIDLVREIPETKKPRQIAIGNQSPELIDQD